MDHQVEADDDQLWTTRLTGSGIYQDLWRGDLGFFYKLTDAG